MADEIPCPPPSIDDILRQLPKLNMSSTSSFKSSNENIHASESSSGHASPLCNVQSFDDWIDYLSSKATPTSEPLPTHSHSPVGLSDHDSISGTHNPPSPSPSYLALSYNEILDRYFPSVPDDDNGNNDKGGKVCGSLFTVWYLTHAIAQHSNPSQPSESRVLKWRHVSYPWHPSPSLTVWTTSPLVIERSPALSCPICITWPPDLISVSPSPLYTLITIYLVLH